MANLKVMPPSNSVQYATGIEEAINILASEMYVSDRDRDRLREECAAGKEIMNVAYGFAWGQILRKR